MANDIGPLREKITLQSCTIAAGARGQTTRTYADWATVHAEAMDAEGRELVAGMKLSAEIVKVFRIRFKDGITPSMRVIHRGSNYDLNSAVDRTGQRRWLFLLCKRAA